METQEKVNKCLESDPPMLSNNPFVNYLVDQVMKGGNVDFNDYDEKLYRDEIAAWKASGGELLHF